MKRFFFAPALVVLMWLGGCASAPKYQSIDLRADLGAATLARYKAELATATEGDCCGRLIEKTDGRLLGWIFLWNGGEVRASEDGFMVKKVFGLGPLCSLWANETMANYDVKGQRLNTMSCSSILWSQFGMIHDMDIRIGENEWHTHFMGELAHHLLGFSVMNGKTSFSMFTVPNPVMVGQ